MAPTEERTRSLFSLVSELPALVLRTVKGEIELVKADLRERVSKGVSLAILLGIAGLLALLALATLVTAGVLALTLVMPGWLAALLVALGLLLIAGLLALIGLSKVKDIKGPLRRPSESAQRSAQRAARRKAAGSTTSEPAAERASATSASAPSATEDPSTKEAVR